MSGKVILFQVMTCYYLGSSGYVMLGQVRAG